eukprot:CAMPEP_0181472362 /NCGR_PEP_ID=MMETSP1110-20121109/39562_1 /TAXON_ID=174948 /ORGANISM="Symbiodinium sp., Strain CCMP421" /LENGTH=64 /DNA_ID=CAMNT_0023597431 /DNA_START=233 /DNA_END=427 /DNA_ORIENTATION=+
MSHLWVPLEPQKNLILPAPTKISQVRGGVRHSCQAVAPEHAVGQRQLARRAAPGRAENHGCVAA